MTEAEKFTQVISENENIIFKITTVYTNTSQDQQDLYQEIVAKIWTAFKRFRGDSKISTWIYRIALNTAITRLRKQKKTGAEVPIDQVVLNYTENSDPVFEERVQTLYRSIEGLEELDKGIILLYLEDRSYEEIAQIIGVTPSNVGTRISRIRHKLKQKMTVKT